MRRILYLIILFFCMTAQAQHTFKGTSLSDALIELDKSSKHYDISFVYDELEDFTVTKTIKRGRSLPEAVREVCGFYPVRVTVKGRDILVECIQKDRTKLTGRLVGPDRQPIAYANITLFPPSDSTYIGGGVSNEAGDFVIPCGAERARVRISCVGFKTIEQVMAVGNAGTIRMQMENNYLSDVTVSGRLSVIRSEADRLQYIVSNDEFARGLNAQELLNRVPMVSMAGGHAMILGKGPARFMLNGRLTEMGDETIQQRLWTM
ncbi:MAG: carboxypeptidase regulatory-like domain-containing protein, partial [Prevotella sp.]|nr:carboxypeptidase regulatory-like domain-containing protein [Prevotella sp.]